jgi:long-chain fatty acid transport protein
MEVLMFLKFPRHLILTPVLFALLTGAAAADEFHYNNFLIGDRASGMGGAYTAVSDDPSGLYYNPAGIVYSTGRNLSASVNAFYNLDKKYDAVIGGQGWERHSSSLLPNFFGITQPLGKFQFGFSYAVPDSIQEDQSQSFFGSFPTTYGTNARTYIINFNNQDNTYNFGPSLAYEINSKISVGMTFYLHHRSSKTILNQMIVLEDGRFEWLNKYVDRVERGFKPIIGIMVSPVDKFTVGLSIARTYLYGDSMDIQETSKFADAATADDFTFETGNNAGSERKYPYEIRAGVGYFASPSLLITADAAYYSKLNDPSGDRVSVVNGAVGAEYYLNKSWAVRGGVFSNLANTPELQAGRSNQDEKIDYYGLSASISNFTRNTSITFGGNMTNGSGKAQILEGSTNIQNADSTGWTIFLSSSYSY